jgi:hypothetical protein
MKHEFQNEFNKKGQQEEVNLDQQLAKEAVREFASPEEMLRHDALHTPVPPRLASRLTDSIQQLPGAKESSWWRKLLGLE